MKISLSIVIVLLIAYAYWSEKSRIHSTDKLYPRYVINLLDEIGKNNGKGNILALSPYLHTYDFSSQDAYYNMLNYYLSFARRKNLMNDSTIVVLPEYIGTWLVCAEEKKSVYSDTALTGAMRTMILSNLAKFAFAYLQSSSVDKASEAIIKMKADKMLQIYQTSFSKLAQTFKITIAAGSIVLPEPTVKNGRMEINKNGKLYNISAVFGPDGKVMPSLSRKIFPIDNEKGFTGSGKKEEIPVYKTNAGNMAILICADAWYPSNYEMIKSKNIDILLVPSYVSGSSSWAKKWKGYNGALAPADVDTRDIHSLTEHDAWLKYGMVGRIQKSGIKTGVNVFLRGDFWNLGSDGNTLITTTKYIKPLLVPQFYEGENNAENSGSLINVWL